MRWPDEDSGNQAFDFDFDCDEQIIEEQALDLSSEMMGTVQLRQRF